MKKIILALTMLMAAAGMAFAQSSDLQVLAVVKYNKSESITVKQLKTKCQIYEKQIGRSLSIDEKKQVLDSYIEEKLVLQAAAKTGIIIPDSAVDQYFMQAMSQSVGAVVTEKQLNDLLKSQNKTLDSELLAQTGMNVADYKAYLKNQLIAQQYIIQLKKADIEKASTPSDAEIRSFYEGNKASFVWADMIKLLAVGVPKDSNADAAKNKANELRNKYVDKKITKEQLITQSQIEGSGYSAQEGIVPKTDTGAASVGLTYDSLLGIYEMNTGYISEVSDRGDAYIFSVIDKYSAKMLGLSDVVSPDSTTTVYEYIRAGLSQQKAQASLQQAAQAVAADLRKPEYVEQKKTGAALEKLLNWGE